MRTILALLLVTLVVTSADANDFRINKTRISSQSDNSMNSVRVQGVVSQRAQNVGLATNVVRKLNEAGQCKNCR